jgi:hypothetical protein
MTLPIAAKRKVRRPLVDEEVSAFLTGTLPAKDYLVRDPLWLMANGAARQRQRENRFLRAFQLLSVTAFGTAGAYFALNGAYPELLLALLAGAGAYAVISSVAGAALPGFRQPMSSAAQMLVAGLDPQPEAAVTPRSRLEPILAPRVTTAAATSPPGAALKAAIAGIGSNIDLTGTTTMTAVLAALKNRHEARVDSVGASVHICVRGRDDVPAFLQTLGYEGEVVLELSPSDPDVANDVARHLAAINVDIHRLHARVFLVAEQRDTIRTDVPEPLQLADFRVAGVRRRLSADDEEGRDQHP